MLGACPPGMRPSGFVRFYGKQPPSRHKKPTASLATSGHQKIPLAPPICRTRLQCWTSYLAYFHSCPSASTFWPRGLARLCLTRTLPLISGPATRACPTIPSFRCIEFVCGQGSPRTNQEFREAHSNTSSDISAATPHCKGSRLRRSGCPVPCSGSTQRIGRARKRRRSNRV